MSDNIHVAVRMRPLISREIESKAAVHWNAQNSTAIYQVNSPSVTFQFDRVFQGYESNEVLYSEFCSPIVKSVIDGFNGTIFAYGQTSSGKTFTMMGDDDGKTLGIIHYTISDIFNFIQEMPEREFLLRVSCMEIYNEKVTDLLPKKSESAGKPEKSDNLKVCEDEYGYITVSGLAEHIVQTSEQVLKLMKQAGRKRKTGETRMNDKSSRSHSIFRMIIESGLRGESDAAVNVSQFNLVDLAGSERASQTGAKGARFKESININKSLLMLSQVISQLSEKVLNDQYINYRDSKLTRILQNSLGGNARTAIICTVTPACLDETLSTLKFAERAKSIKNRPQVNEVLTEQALLKKYANQIKTLMKELEATKEEKDQQNKDLQMKIQKLKTYSVFQMAPEVKSRSTRRETWGGCLDVAKFRMANVARKPLLSTDFPVLEEPILHRKSYTPQRQYLPSLEEEFESLPHTPQRQILFSDLPTLEEESEFDADTTEVEHPFFYQPSKYFPKQSFDVPQITNTIVQTDLERQSISPSESEKVQSMSERILSLEKELAELQEFTTLERQMLRAKNRQSLDSKTDEDKTENMNLTVEKPVNDKRSIESGAHSKIGDQDTINLYDPECIANNFSTVFENPPCEDIFNSENIEQKEVTDLKLNQYANSPNNKQLVTSDFDEDKDEFFHYLENTMKILSKRKNIDSVSMSDSLTGHYKVMLDMFNLILQYQCLTFKGSFRTDLSKKIDEISDCLTKIFYQFRNHPIMNETTEDLVEKFIDKTNTVLKEIEMFSLDGDDEKNTINNQAMHVKSFMAMHSFENSLINISDAKSPDFSPLRTDIAHIQLSTEATRNTNNLLHSDAGALLSDQISALQKDIDMYERTISDIKYDSELKDKQISIFRDKVVIQEQIINRLQDELTIVSDRSNTSSGELSNAHLTNNTVVTSIDCSIQTAEEIFNLLPNLGAVFTDSYSQTLEEFYNVVPNIKAVATLTDSSSQTVEEVLNLHSSRNTAVAFANRSSQTTYFEAINMSILNLGKGLSDELEPNTEVTENLCNEEKDTLDFSIESSLKANEINTVEENANELEMTLQDLTELRLFALEFMKRDMKKGFLGDVESIVNNENSPLPDQIKIEITTLKELLMRLEFYLKDRTEAEEFFNTVLEKNMQEKFSLKEQLSDLESNMKGKDTELLSIEKSLLDIENNMTALIQNLRNNSDWELLEWDDTIFSFLHKSNSSNRLKSLENMVLNLDSFVRKYATTVADLSMKLHESEDALQNLQKKSQATPKLTQSVQTSEDIELMKAYSKLKKSESIMEDMKKEINNMKMKIGIMNDSNESLEQKLKDRESFYSNEIRELKESFETGKLTWVASTQKCMTRVEEKCDQMMIEQENTFANEVSKLKEEHRAQLLKKEENNNIEWEKWQCQIKELKEEYKRNTTETENELNKRIEDRYSEKMRLEEEMENLKKEMRRFKEVNSYLKDKCRKFIGELHKLRGKSEKSFKDKETQTNLMLFEANVKEQEKCLQTQTVLNSIAPIQETLEVKSDFCSQCKILIQEISALRNSKKNSDVSNDANANLKGLENKLQAQKAKIISLKTNNANIIQEIIALKKELSAKSILLRSCQCRLTAKPLETDKEKNKMIQETVQEEEAKLSKKRNEDLAINNCEILKSDIVQRAILEAREEERAVLNSGSGPAGQMKCFYLERKLNKKDKELESLKKELADLKTYSSKRRTIGYNNHPIDFEENKNVTVINPLPQDSIPKVQPKKILKEMNRRDPIYNNPLRNPLKSKVSEKAIVENIAPATYTPLFHFNKADSNHVKTDKALETKRQIEAFTSGAPECKQQ